MNHTRKLVCLLLILTLALALSLTAFAAGETYTITIKDAPTGHTYEAYQIFAGDLHTEGGKKVLSNIKWGSGVIEAGQTALGDAAAAADLLHTEADAKAFAGKVSPYLTSPKTSTETNGTYTISGLEPGYYLVKDRDNSLSDSPDDFYTDYILEVVGDVTARPKGGKPTLDKQIKHNENGAWGVVGDNQIGDTVEFRTTTSVPDTQDYTRYIYTIHDTMSEGLTSNVKGIDDVQIKVNDTEILDKTYYTVAADGNNFTVTVDILRAVADRKMEAGNTLYAYYTAVLNAGAKIYNDGRQENTAYLEYSNNPNGAGTGKTPEKTVYDWTFKMTVDKTNELGTTITGAKFVLSRNGTLSTDDMNCSEDGVPAVTTDLIGLVKGSGGVYRIALAGEENTIYVIEAGEAVIQGLDDNEKYYLYETKAPAGFNMLTAPVDFKIGAEYSSDGSACTKATTTVGEHTTENLKINVANKAGAELPSTGGVGTTIFYVLGGLLVAGAVVLLVTKKRMAKD